MQERGEIIRDILIEEDMKDAYINFAMSVIVNRALPDVRDGLKPSQRRILVAMNDLNLSPTAKYRKSAKIAGDTAGNYHPHPESIYMTMVRMAQPFAHRYVLIDGQGNFGSIDGDGPAAVRYTEARLSHPGQEMLADINMDTVEFVKNYDQSRDEPTVLPARFPNLLVNGSTGIAVGMATNIPPHNLAEVIDSLLALIDNPQIRIAELMEHVNGPDFPTGGIIVGQTGIRKGYLTGHGAVTVRARSHIEEGKNDRKHIVITEIPYQVNRTTIKERIADAVNADRISGISDFRDESDRKGQRLVIDLKRGEEPQVVLNQLYMHTPLQTTFGINMIALVHGRPRTLNLKDMLVCFRDHRIEVVMRRTSFMLRRAEERAHILEGLLVALQHIDEIIELIKKSSATEEARNALIDRFEFTVRQATAILQMQLQRLTNLEQQKLRDEHGKLMEQIQEYKSILANPERVLQIIRDDLLEIKKKYGDERRTTIDTNVEEEFDMTDLIADDPMVVTFSHQGYVKRLGLDTYTTQGRGGKGITGAATRDGDVIKHMFVATAHQYLLFFTSAGRVHWKHVYDIPEQSRQARGRAVVNLLELQKGETVTSIIPVDSFDERDIVFATAKGMVKRGKLRDFSRPMRGGIRAIGLIEGDVLIGVAVAQSGQDILIGTKHGRAIRFAGKDVRCMGRTARGVRGVRLRADDEAVGMVIVGDRTSLLTICEQGYGKRTNLSEYPVKGRGGLGVLNIKTTQRNGGVVGLLDVDDDDGIMAITSNGLIIRMSCKGIRPMGRNTQGVRLVSLKKGDHVVSVACVEEDDEKPEDEPETEPTDEPETEPTDEPEGESEGEPEDEGEQDNDQEE
ncbi:MAG: DNA gyrase subunit A [Planctomycetes bacterium]|nr:DNA gyrase subunit A [Planctomycetota bacterium]